MPVIHIRSRAALEAIRATDDDFQDTMKVWFSEVGDSLEDFLSVVSAQPHAPWVVRTTDGANVGIITPAQFAGEFEDIAATDVLDEVYMELQRHSELGYTWAHDDSHGSGHLIEEARSHLNATLPAGKPTDAERRKELVQAASLIVAAINTIDRAQNVRTFGVG